MAKIQTTKRATPEAIARDVKAWLRKHRDPKRAAFLRKYFKETDKVDFFGISTPLVRDYEKSLWERFRGTWTLADAVRLCDLMLPDKYHEMKSIAVIVLLRFQKEFGSDLFGKIKSWLEKDACNSWAAVDILCPDALGVLYVRYPELVERVKSWADHPNRWVKRGSAVGFIKTARRGLCLDAAYDVAERLFIVPDDLIHKATGWLLRESGKTDAARLEAFLRRHGPRIPRTTLRYAVERFPEAKRKRLLQETKG